MRPFAEFYDLIYADKDYAADVAAFATMVGAPLANLDVLELGAGTGGQTFVLAPRVRTLTALEIDPDFIGILRGKTAQVAPSNLSLATHGVERATGTFGAACAFFHVLNYLGIEALTSLLTGVSARLEPGASFVADIWGAEAVMNDPPRAEVRQKKSGDVSVRQAITPHLDVGARRVRLDYDITISKPGAAPRNFQERLDIRLWPLAELMELIRAAGFARVDAFDYRAFPAPATSSSWRLWLRAVKETA